MENKEYLELMGARIRSELNDLKRTSEAAAAELNFDLDKLSNILNGNCTIGDAHVLIKKMGEFYPIDPTDLYILQDDCTNGVKIIRAAESKSSARIFNRQDGTGVRSSYYEYRDTAMSRLGPFKPEWIKELRVVDNSDPKNPDVVYNNGHFMHQITFFIGPVNFYWEVNGKKYSAEMHTGDSNYINPFHPHSFASRDASKDALIIAVTFGGDVRRAQKELYALGERGVKESMLDYRHHNKAVIKLLQQHMNNEKLSQSNIEDMIKSKGLFLSTDITSLFTENQDISGEDIDILARVLNIEPSDLMIPIYRSEEEVVVKHKDEAEGYFYPSEKNPFYKINTLARTSKMPLMKGFDIRVLGKNLDMKNAFESSLHSYVYNYGNSRVQFGWEWKDKSYKETLYPGDSIYMQPFIKHSFSNSEGKDAKLVIIGVSGAMNLSTQRELSYFSDYRRIAHETKRWFD